MSGDEEEKTRTVTASICTLPVHRKEDVKASSRRLLQIGGLAAPAVFLFLLAGCAVGPDYKRAETALPEQYSGAGAEWKVAAPADNVPKGNWWEVFGYTNLNALEEDAATNNQDLKAALAVFEEARATVAATRSGYFPQAAFAPYWTRERDSANRPVTGQPAGSAITYNTFALPVDASYEVDLWGNVRRKVEAARAEAAADKADLEGIKLSIQAEVAMDYFSIHALDAEIALLRSSLDVFQKSLDLTRNRRAGGIATDLDVAQAETVLKTTEAQIPVTMLQRVNLQHALAVLTGRLPSSFSVPEKVQPFVLPLIPAGLPSELLERRPDVAAAERRMAEANANIGVAKSAFYPSISISGALGLESVNAGSLLNASSRLWSVGPALNLPLFEGGRLRAGLKLALAAQDEEVAHYRQTVLNAFRDVEDNLAAEQLLLSEHEAQDVALEAARKTLDIANNRYRAGLVTYLEVATAQNAELDLERTLVRLRGQQLVTAVGLIKSLGGGWKAEGEEAKHQ
jgi:multidrug efflux system outer membrane protein